MKTDAIERLTRLNDLRSSGALTAEEFEAEKRKLLAERPRWPIFAGVSAAALVSVAVASTWIVPRTKPTQTPPPAARIVQPMPATVLPPSAPVETPAERLAAAFEAATGHHRTFTQVLKGDTYTISPVEMLDLPFGPALLVKREIKDGCHACTGFLGVYYLREVGGQTDVVRSFPEAVSGWGWGAAPTKWQLTGRFTANPAIFASGGFMGQGVVESSATITELRPEGPIASDVIGTGYSDAGAITDDNPRTACELAGRITNVVKDQGFDVAISGSLTGKDRYVKRLGKFSAVNKRDWGLPCPTANAGL